MTPFLNPFARNFLCPHVSLVTVSSPIVLVLIGGLVTRFWCGGRACNPKECPWVFSLGGLEYWETLSAGCISRMFYVNHRKICDGDGEREKPVCD